MPIAGMQSLAISFRPATEADQQTLESYLPDTIESVEDLPTQLPANTINMIGEITVDGEVVGTTIAFSVTYVTSAFSNRYFNN